MTEFQQGVFWSIIGFVVGILLCVSVAGMHHRTASMEYGDGQVLMLLLDTYPVLTKDARDTLVKYLGDGYITKWEYDIIMRQATKAVYYDLGDVMRPIVRNPC